MHRFTKKIIRPGTYWPTGADGKPREFKVTPQRLKHWVGTFRRMRKDGLKIPAPWRHEQKAVPVRLKGDTQDIDSYNNGGFWEKLRISDDGWLVGDVVTKSEEAAKRIGKTVQAASILNKDRFLDPGKKQYNDCLTHIAMVTHPRVNDAEQGNFVAASGEFALSMEMLDPNASVDPDSEETVPVSLDSALEVLSKLGLDLPSDTDESNFIDRLVTAGQAVLSAKEREEGDADVTEPPKGAEEGRPSPIAMSDKTAQFAADILGKLGGLNEATGKPWTAQELEDAAKVEKKVVSVKLSAEDQAAINGARLSAKKQLVGEVETFVKSGRITPQQAKKFLESADKVQDQFAFSAEGDLVLPDSVQLVMDSWRDLQEGAVMAGKPTGDAFSLLENFDELQSPADTEDLTLSDDQIVALASGVGVS